MSEPTKSSADPEAVSGRLPFSVKLAYGSGELGPALVGNMMIFYLLFFLTNVAGIPAGLAGMVPMVGKIWDAINDPIIGWLSDHTRNRKWGRRLSWMLAFMVPCAVIIALQWWVPPFDSAMARFWYYVAIVFLYNAVSSAITVPHTSLMPELTADYEERTNLVSFRSAFSISGSVGFIVLAGAAQFAGLSGERLYFVLGLVCSIILIGTVLWCVFGIRTTALARERALAARTRHHQRFPIREQLRIVFTNKPFLYVCAVFTFSWLAVQITASVLVYYAIYWMRLPESQVPALMLSVMGTAVLVLPLWVRLSHRKGKKTVYGIGMGFFIAAQIGLMLLQPSQTVWMYVLGVAAGFGVSTAYLIPWSLVPEIIEYDELKTGQRREGVYYGFMVLLQKVGLGLAVFLVGIALEAAGFLAKSPGQPPPEQPESALTAIRIAIGPLPGICLVLGLLAAWFYPITKKKYQTILAKLESRSRRVG